MMQMGLVLCCLIGAGLGFGLLVTSEVSAETASKRHDSSAQAPEEMRLEAKQFAILPWGSTVGDEEVLRDIWACGFNLAGFVHPKDVGLVEKVGLQCFVSDPEMSRSIHMRNLSDAEVSQQASESVAPFRNNKAVYGFYLMDEPNSSVFPGLGKWAAGLREADPQTVPYINLFPNYASPAQLGEQTYEEYLDAFVETTKPDFISYDHYALMDDGSLRHGYFQNLEAVRSAALRHDLPFWNIFLGNAHFRYAEPSAGGLHFQAYTTLAYGGRGISYFTYFAPKIGNYRSAPVDQFSNKTPTWDLVRNVNLQIHKLGPTYIQLRSVNVFHHSEVPDGCQGIETSHFLEDLSGGTFVVGEFENPEGRGFVMVVNKDFHNSTAFALKFKEPGSVSFISPYTGTSSPWRGENNWLAPGQGMLLNVDTQGS